jgi:hypothetical protein
MYPSELYDVEFVFEAVQQASLVECQQRYPPIWLHFVQEIDSVSETLEFHSGCPKGNYELTGSDAERLSGTGDIARLIDGQVDAEGYFHDFRALEHAAPFDEIDHEIRRNMDRYPRPIEQAPFNPEKQPCGISSQRE